jgi:hypothetical protein
MDPRVSGSDLSAEEIEAIRDQTDAWVHILIDLYLDQQWQGRNSRGETTRFDPGLVGKWISLETNVLAESGNSSARTA